VTRGEAGTLILSVAILTDRSGHVVETCRESLARFTPELLDLFEMPRGAAVGEAVARTRAPFMAFLDGRIAVSPGWAARLIGALERSGAGAVGPLSNGGAGPQHWPGDYQDIPDFLQFAERIARERAGRVEPVEALEGFCILCRRELLATLDPATRTDDLPLAVRAAGHRVVVALDTYLHSFAGYHEHARAELQRLIPSDARIILDVGCGAGALGAALKRRGPVEVVGVEADPDAARAARQVLDRVHVGDIEALELPYGPGTFDCIVVADILEHLRDPWAALRRLVPLLSGRGRLIASLPNVRHWSVVRGLLEGGWTYLPAGILDRDHLRFFTLRSGRALLESTGLAVLEVHAMRSGSIPDLTALIDAGRSLSLDLSTLTDEAGITQYLYVAERQR
jgi:SAM-dependent methyltransferase